MKNQIFSSFKLAVLAVVIIVSIGFYYLFSQGQFKSFFSTNLTSTSSQTSTATPAKFYSTKRPIHTAFLFQDQSSPKETSSSNLQTAISSLFHNLKTDQNYQTIVVILDPSLPETQSDPFEQQAKYDFPQASYHSLRIPSEQTETQIYQRLKLFDQPDTLFVFHGLSDFYSTNANLQEVKKSQFKNVFDNLNKQALATLPISNQEALKALYQINKDNGSLKALPTLENQDNFFNIKYLTSGKPSSTNIATLTLAGDIMLDRNVKALMDKYGQDYPFSKMDESLLQTNDLLIANLEGPIAEKRLPTSKSIAFRFDPNIAPLLKKWHFDLLSASNNHAYDMGKDALDFTRKTLSNAGLISFGDPKFQSPEYVSKQDINGQKLAFIGLNNTDFKLDQEKTLELIRNLKAEGYQPIPFIHWGTEYIHTPTQEQITLAHAFVDAGAAAVIGMHPHVVESFEIYNEKPIFYSLGNAVFDQYFSPDTQEGLITTLQFNQNNLTIYLFPINIVKSQMSLMDKTQSSEFLNRFSEYWRYDQAIKDQILKGKIVINSQS